MRNLFALCLFLACLMPATAQTADEILEKNLEAVGAKVASEIKSLIVNSTISMENGMVIESVQYTKEPDKVLVKQKVPAIGAEMVQGRDGNVFYANDPYMGLRKLEGQDRDQLAQSEITAQLDYKKTYPKRSYVGPAEVEGKKTHKIQLETASGMKLINYYDASSFLLIKSEITVVSAMGSVTAETFYDEYRDIYKGLNVPVTTRLKTMQINGIAKTGEIEVNPEIPDSMFAPPAGLQ